MKRAIITILVCLLVPTSAQALEVHTRQSDRNASIQAKALPESVLSYYVVDPHEHVIAEYTLQPILRPEWYAPEGAVEFHQNFYLRFCGKYKFLVYTWKIDAQNKEGESSVEGSFFVKCKHRKAHI